MTLPAPIVATADAAPRTLAGVLQHALSSHDRVALTQADRPGEDVTYPALLSAAREVAAGLAALGVEAGDRVGIFASTRADWTVADVGALLCGAIVVPIYHTSAPEEVQYIVEHSGARVVLCEEGAPRTTLDAVADSCPALEHKIVLGESAAEDGLAGLRARGREVGDGIVAGRLDGLRPDDIATIVYTSGTTGRPKGCMLTHANVLAAVDMYCDRLGLRERAMSVFFFLPLAHVLARVTQYVVLSTGGTLHFWSGDPARLAQELRAAGPTHFPAVPRIYEKIHAVVHAGAEEHGRVRRALFGWALEQGRRTAAVRRGERSEPPARVVRGVADRLVLSRVRAAFGGNLDVALTGAAPIAADILEFFDACGVVVLEGYGLTESFSAEIGRESWREKV
jgi:long-chain acyl-CoA synthetase